MKNGRKILIACLYVAFGLFLLGSCKDDYVYDNETPDWLGANIYEYLESSGKYKTYLALIDELGHGEALSRTGSKTLFPADDDAFARYFASLGLHDDGPTLVRSLSNSEKNYLFNSSMLNMSYLSHMLSNVASDDIGGGEGMALKHESSATYLDTIPFVEYNRLPQTSFWERFKKPGGAYLVDNGSRPMLHFTPGFYNNSGLTENDWTVMMRGQANMPYDGVGFYVNGVHAEAGNVDVTCKNGYLHLVNDVVRPLPNMAEIISAEERMSQFSYMMEKFAYPVYDQGVDRTVKAMWGLPAGDKDSVTFVKRYFNRENFNIDPNEKIDIPSYGMLAYDPAENNWGGNTDMGAIFVPSNEALQTYWESEEGKFLRDNYADFSSVSTNVISAFLQNHQRRSFKQSYPHSWKIMSDDSGMEMGVKPEDVERTFTGCNGIVYLTNRVYAPVDYQSVYAPVLVSDSTTLMYPIIKNENQDSEYNLKYHFYLRSLDNRYNLLVPTNGALAEYREPVSWALWANGVGTDVREIWSFRLDMGDVVADIYNVDMLGGKGTLKGIVKDQAKITNRLRDIMDMHIVVADDDTEPMSGYVDENRLDFVLTKGGSLLMPQGLGTDLEVYAGANWENGLEPARVQVVDEVGTKGRYEMTNGRTFFIDRVLEDPFKSVYTVMNGNERFSKFFKLLQGDPVVFEILSEEKDIEPIFDQMVQTKSSGIGPVVTSFNNYSYTVLVPTNEAIDEAFATDPNLYTWEEIALDKDNLTALKKKTVYLLNFLRYHFIDGIIPVSSQIGFTKEYETAARNAANRFVTISAKSESGDLTFVCGDKTARVVTSNAEDYNLLTRDIIVNNKDPQKATEILASSRAVIHLIDKALNYQKK